MANLNDYFKEYFTDKTGIRTNYVKNALYKQRRLAFNEINDAGYFQISSLEEHVLYFKWTFFGDILDKAVPLTSSLDLSLINFPKHTS